MSPRPVWSHTVPARGYFGPWSSRLGFWVSVWWCSWIWAPAAGPSPSAPSDARALSVSHTHTHTHTHTLVKLQCCISAHSVKPDRSVTSRPCCSSSRLCRAVDLSQEKFLRMFSCSFCSLPFISLASLKNCGKQSIKMHKHPSEKCIYLNVFEIHFCHAKSTTNTFLDLCT